MNLDLVRRLGAAFTFLLASSLVAQSISVPGPSLPAGSSVTIGVSDPSKANSTVYVNITSQGPTPVRVQVPVTLNGSGVGEAPWTVPATGWTKAYFNYPNTTQISRLVE